MTIPGEAARAAMDRAVRANAMRERRRPTDPAALERFIQRRIAAFHARLLKAAGAAPTGTASERRARES